MSTDGTSNPIDPLDHLGLVQDMVGHYLAQGIDRRDLFQEGFLGLVHAIKIYDPTRARFSTHAHNWIRHYISDLAFNYNRVVRIPPSTRSLVRGVQIGRIDPSQLAPAEIDALASYEAHFLRDERDEERPYLAMIAGRESMPFEQASAQDNIEHFLRILTQNEREIVTRYFGLDEQPEESCKQIAARRGVSWQRVAQILNRAISRMQLRVGIKAELRIKNTGGKKEMVT